MTGQQTSGFLLSWFCVGHGPCFAGRGGCANVGPVYDCLENEAKSPPVCPQCVGQVEADVATRREQTGATCAYCSQLFGLNVVPAPDYSGRLIRVCSAHRERAQTPACACGSREFTLTPAPVAVIGGRASSVGFLPTCAHCGRQPQQLANAAAKTPERPFAGCPHNKYAASLLGVVCGDCGGHYDTTARQWRPAFSMESR